MSKQAREVWDIEARTAASWIRGTRIPTVNRRRYIRAVIERKAT